MTNSEEQIELTRQRKEAAAQSIQPVKRSFQKGQKIIEEGMIVTADDEYVIRKISEQIKKNHILSVLGYFLMTALIMVLSLFFLRLEDRSLLADAEQYKLIGVLFIVCLLLAKISYSFSTGSDKEFFDDSLLSFAVGSAAYEHASRRPRCDFPYSHNRHYDALVS
jgi:membrane-associated HD superfamily phosphohydrolase